MRITIVKRLINNYCSRARLRSVRRSRVKFTIARLFRASSSVFWRTACTLYIANRDNGLSGYLSAVCARVADVSSIVNIGNRLRAPEISLQAFRARISPLLAMAVSFYSGIQLVIRSFVNATAVQVQIVRCIAVVHPR